MNYEIEEDEVENNYWPMKNRDRVVKQPKSSNKFWCNVCDSALIGRGEKCPKCGNRDRKLA